MSVVNFTPIFNNTADLAHVNITYTYSTLPLQGAPINVWYLFIGMSVTLLLISCIDTKGEGVYTDLAGALATIFAFISTIWAFNLDQVNGVGMASQMVNGVPEWVLIESHTIYHIDLGAAAMGIITVICFANLYRLWTDYHKVVTPTMPVPDSTQGAGPTIPGHPLKNRPDTPNRPSKSYSDYDYQRGPGGRGPEQ